MCVVLKRALALSHVNEMLNVVSEGRGGNILSGSVKNLVDDVNVTKVWDQLKTDPNSVLIDVRTQAEWAFVGVVDLSTIDKEPILMEWQAFPDMSVTPEFVKNLDAELTRRGVDRTADLFFICRSGQRSLAAAKAMAAIGYEGCHNVASGFEGPLNGDRHRGSVSGWKAGGLPWAQR